MKNEDIRILIVDDEPDFRHVIIKRLMKRAMRPIAVGRKNWLPFFVTCLYFIAVRTSVEFNGW